jgi:hypothetical protein
MKLKAFRAIANAELSEKFAEGHENVLASYGITKVTSANRDWMTNPNVYVVLATDKVTGEAIGGARIHTSAVAFPLPMEEAVGDLDNRIFELVANYSEKKSGEICGVWNSRSLSGSGLSVLLLRACLAKSSMIIANQLDLGTLFAFCAPWTVQMFANVGYKVEESVGNKGTYSYPRPDLLATVMIMKDPKNLTGVVLTEKEGILNLRSNPRQNKFEDGKKDVLNVDYDLIIESLVAKCIKTSPSFQDEFNSAFICNNLETVS